MNWRLNYLNLSMRLQYRPYFVEEVFHIPYFGLHEPYRTRVQNQHAPRLLCRPLRTYAGVPVFKFCSFNLLLNFLKLHFQHISSDNPAGVADHTSDLKIEKSGTTSDIQNRHPFADIWPQKFLRVLQQSSNLDIKRA